MLCYAILCVCIHMCVYIYIYIEREREREREGGSAVVRGRAPPQRGGQVVAANATASWIEQLPNHRHRNLKAFEEHIFNSMFLIVSLQSNVYGSFLG